MIRARVAVMGLVGFLFLESGVQACQQCEVWVVGVGKGRVVKWETDRPVANAIVKLREAPRRRGKEEPFPFKSLGCSASYARGRALYSAKTDKNGEFDFSKLKKGDYWLIIKGDGAQLVRLIEFAPDDPDAHTTRRIDYAASETGLVGNMCDVENLDDFF